MDLVAKAGLLLHAVAAGALVGSLTHLAVVVWRTTHGKPRPRLLRLYPTLAACLWAAVFALGSLIYPNYRVAVRANYLDEHAPAVSILFDIKENLATLMGPLLLAAWALTRADSPSTAGPRALPMVVYALAFVAWFDLLAGLLVTSVRAIG